MRPLRIHLKVQVLALATVTTALRDGATLAPPKILDLGSDPVGISRILGNRDGVERTTIAREIEQRAARGIRVTGFTDNLSPSAHGGILTAQRAGTVRDALAAKLRSESEAVIRDTWLRGAASARFQRHGGRTQEEPARGTLLRVTG